MSLYNKIIRDERKSKAKMCLPFAQICYKCRHKLYQIYTLSFWSHMALRNQDQCPAEFWRAFASDAAKTQTHY
jgi:hypothetical protein